MTAPQERATAFRLDVSRETGRATLWMADPETACGFKPVLAWPSMDGVREFAYMLLEIDRRRVEEQPGSPPVSGAS